MTELLRLTNAHKSFGGVHALRGADFVIEHPGEVRTLIGENGSGKSTLLGILSGQLRPDSGTLTIDGRTVEFHSPRDALRAGIVMVTQETSVASNLCVAENVLLGRIPRTRFGVDQQAMHRRAATVLESLGLHYDTHDIVGSLRPDQRQMIEIARTMSMRARVVILDEPTSSLTNTEVDGLFQAVERLRSQDVAVIFVSHRLREVFQISDAISVLRDGRTVAAAPVAGFTTDTLVDAMIGSSGAREPRSASAGAGNGATATVLQIRNLTVPSAVTDLSLDLHDGEVLGVAGLEGCGRSELLETMFGLRRPGHGSMLLNGTIYSPRTPRDAIDAGVAYLPPDRKLSGLVLGMTIGENLAMASDAKRFALAPPNAKSQQHAFSTARDRTKLKAATSRVNVGTLSGGNQQKVALGKWLSVDARVLLLDEPTRGVDVAAKADIHASIRAAAAAGAAVIVSSSEYPELLTLCDRVVVLFAGRVVGVVHRSSATEAELARLAGGHAAEDRLDVSPAANEPNPTSAVTQGQT